ncbi:sulfurtransferase TusA family protein [Aquisalibacillus elongatus]|uniref:Rhodanese-related sulfurtransferase n=1 Tax=Aquisalibacillus elongatus TaxID=485577 RepID=A0A3N5B1M4_9BACI|nr:sulfurtransferase TusA family protein [Aquisalibacillus elongatus]RPF51157.1 rhodanese-related sulfurtransferase [Aquisalibacillus elongatus]
MTDIKADHVLDAKGLACPMPIVKTRKEIENIEGGKVLLVEATDQGSKADLKAWAERSGHQYLGTVEEDDVLRHYVRKASEGETEEDVSFDQKVNNDELKQKLDSDQVTVLDVRESAEYAFGHIPNAISIPFGELEDRVSELNQDDEIYVVCRTGNRSDMAAKLLSEKGFENVYNVVPGMSEWDGDVNSQ